MTADPDPFEQGQRAAREKFRLKAIHIRTAASNMRCGPQVMNKSRGAIKTRKSKGSK